MNSALTIQERLKDLRVEHALTLEQLEQRTGISKSALGNYETEDYKDISHTSIVMLAKFYGVSADYLLGLTETKNHPNTDLTELHLGDGMIELLKSGNINTRILCEMAAHRDFVKLLADIEIYVDGIASMQVQNLNAYVNLARDTIEKKYRPGEHDRHIRILNAAHIKEDEYFRHVVHDDMDGIIKSIKQAHRQDTTSAPETDFVQELKQDLEFVSSIEGSAQKKQVALYCRRLGVDYTKLTDVEFDVMMRVLGKSKHLKRQGKKQGRKKRK
ncbi:helix-turn-helix domain-containing protein [Lacrimispora sp.]|uniref:helix-turn-helix domain-containing protein n=1 Tax=Lacrimispora sp. TaxID=2719234 RepID=UPI00289FE153|nr:helix-turn-helix transcriptional regulator [Lacrimispora sp.]